MTEMKKLLELLDLAKDLARLAHRGQKYGVYDYYEYHIKGVARNVEKLAVVQGVEKLTPEMKIKCIIGAFLHDAVEDSELTLEDLRLSEFPEDIIEAVGLVTKTEETVIEEYLVAIRENEIAYIVKVADMTFNITNTIAEQNPKRFEKYAGQMKILLGK